MPNGDTVPSGDGWGSPGVSLALMMVGFVVLVGLLAGIGYAGYRLFCLVF